MKLRDWFELIRIQLGREEGQTMAEYGLLVALIAVVAIAGATALGGSVNGVFNSISGKI
jgi:pilus assembly protein Flp/PilA